MYKEYGEVSMLKISNTVTLDENEVEISAIRASGSGGQKVNKVSAAIHLRFDIEASSLPDYYKEKLLDLKDKRITKEGIIVIKSQQHRSQEQNRDEALERLVELIKSVNVVQKKRVPTKPTKGSVGRRLDSKKKQSNKKKLRGKVESE
jgi:ribosome-associated protein